jgi:uncharacterized protein YndB with AHSA1/START domain
MTTSSEHIQKSSDRIEKKISLRAARERVWRALTSAQEFGTWFRVKFEGEFAVGKSIRGKITIPGFDHVTMEVLVEQMNAEKLFSFRWHPYAVDPNVDYSSEPMTLVEFHLEAMSDGTLLTVTESGFDKIPASRRAEAFRMNDGGWADQIQRIKAHVGG